MCRQHLLVWSVLVLFHIQFASGYSLRSSHRTTPKPQKVTNQEAHTFTAYCSYRCQKAGEPSSRNCSSATRFGMVPCSQTVTGRLSYTGIYPGQWPTLTSAGTVDTNGGVPQAGNLTLHLDGVRRQIPLRVPDEAFTGNIVIDFEQWRPTWSMLPAVYKSYSKKLVVDKWPALANFTLQVEALATAEFEAGAVLFFTETLKAIRHLRPLAQVGFYGFPYWSAPNDLLKPIWEASSALFPAAYIDEVWALPPFPKDLVRTIVNRTAFEAARVSREYMQGAPVLPFIWALYNPSTFPNGSATGNVPMTVESARQVVEGAWVPPQSVGVVLWGLYDSTVSAEYSGLYNNTGPVLLAAKQDAGECSRLHCSGNGWCAGIGRVVNTTCICGEGFAGLSCETKA